jgi:hypothetical protein
VDASASILARSGALYAQQEDTEQAQAKLSQALPLVEQMKAVHDKGLALMDVATIYEASGDSAQPANFSNRQPPSSPAKKPGRTRPTLASA